TSGGKPIQNGDVINSASQKSVGDIINAAQTAVCNLNEISADIKVMTGSMREDKGSIGKFLNDESFYVNLDGPVRQAEKLLADVRDRKGPLGQPATTNKLRQKAR